MAKMTSAKINEAIRIIENAPDWRQGYETVLSRCVPLAELEKVHDMIIETASYAREDDIRPNDIIADVEDMLFDILSEDFVYELPEVFEELVQEHKDMIDDAWENEGFYWGTWQDDD